MKTSACFISHKVRFALFAALLFLLPSIFAACSRSKNFSMALEMKDYLTEVLSADSSQYAKKQLVALDTLKVDSDKSRREVFSIMNSITRNHLHNGRNIEAIKYLNGALRILENNSGRDTLDTRTLIGAYVGIGAAYEQAGMPGVGLDYYMKGLDLAADTIYSSSRAMLYNNIGVLYYEGGIFDKAEHFFRKALNINLKAGNNAEIYLNYANLAGTYESTGELQRAVDAALRSLQHVTPEKNPESYYYTQIALANLYNRTGDVEMATTYATNAISHLEQINYVIGMVEGYETYARIYLKRNMPDSAMAYADKSHRMARAAGLHRNESAALSVMIDACNARGNSEQAIKMLERSRELEDSLHNAENRLRLTQWEAYSESKIGSIQVEKKGSDKWLIGGCVALLAVAIVMLVYFLRRNKREDEFRREADDTRELLRTLDQKNRELTSLSLEKMRVHEGVLSLCDDLRQLLLEYNPKLSAQRSRLRELLGKLNSISNTNPDEEFHHFFAEVHPDFYKELMERCPDLTMRDRRLCAFLYLGLTTKEIATITYREVRSVESARNRLRKKLNLDLTADLTAFLRSLAP